MAMNFFQHQEAARRRTGYLVLYFIVAVVLLILVVYAIFTGIFVYTQSRPGRPAPGWWQPGLFLLVAGAVVLLVGTCSVVKIAELSSGGRSVALMLGAQEVAGNTRDARERRLLNIVEEMSIASGVPMPQVYVLEDEDGINAFAAGYSPGDAVVAVSRGSLEYLTRDELQGVVAHEFSHILNGDMRLNIRLIGIIAGLIGLAVIGGLLMRSSGRRSSSSESSKGQGQMFLLGLGLYILGLGGAFFGNLIKAAVSRQREFLADASAVQFTRNPD